MPKKLTSSAQWENWPKEYTPSVGVTQTLLGNAMACPRRLWYMLNRYYDPTKQGTYAFGKLMHSMLDRFYSGVIKDEEGIAEFLDQDSLSEKDTKILSLASAVGRAYFINYRKEFATPGISPEATFEVPYMGATLRGKRDLRFIKKRGKVSEAWLMEHKFWSQIDPEQLVTLLQYDFQVNFYSFTEYLEKKAIPTGIVYNIVRKPQNKFPEDGDARKFEEKVFTAIMENPKYYFHRVEIAANRNSILRFETDLKHKIHHLHDMLKGPIYRNEFACMQKFACEYRDSCFKQSVALLRQHDKLFNELEEE